MKMKCSVSAVLAAGLSLLLLAGCGSGAGESTGDKKAETQTAKIESQETETPKTTKAVTLQTEETTAAPQETAAPATAGITDFLGSWDSAAGRWSLTIVATGADELNISEEGAMSADEYSVMEASGKLKNGTVVFSDAVRTNYRFSETGEETVSAKYTGGHGTLELRDRSFDYQSADDTVSVLVPAGEEFQSASRYLLYKSENGPEETVQTEQAVSDQNAGSRNIDWDSLSNDEIAQGLLDARFGEDEYLMPESDKEYLPESLLNRLTDDNLRLIINEIYARRGRRFNSQELQDYFNGKTWYHGSIAPESFDESVFNVYEKANVELIGRIQNERKGTDSIPLAGSRFRKDWVYGLYRCDFGDGREFTLEVGMETDSGFDYMIFEGFHVSDGGYIQLIQDSDSHWHSNTQDYELFYNGIDSVTVIRPGGGELQLFKTEDMSANVG